MSLTILLPSKGFLVNFTSAEETFHCRLWSEASNAFLLQNAGQSLRKQTIDKQTNTKLGILISRLWKWNIAKKQKHPYDCSNHNILSFTGIAVSRPVHTEIIISFFQLRYLLRTAKDSSFFIKWSIYQLNKWASSESTCKWVIGHIRFHDIGLELAWNGGSLQKRQFQR